MTTKRNEGDLPAPIEGIAEQPITRARAIKLLGAMGATGAFALVAGGTAEARPNRRRRRLRRRRIRRQRQRNVRTDAENSTINFEVADLAELPLTREVRLINTGDTPVTVRPELVGDGFTLLRTDGTEIANGDTVRIPANAERAVRVRLTELLGGASTGTLRLVDARDGLVLETVDLAADLL